MANSKLFLRLLPLLELEGLAAPFKGSPQRIVAQRAGRRRETTSKIRTSETCISYEVFAKSHILLVRPSVLQTKRKRKASNSEQNGAHKKARGAAVGNLEWYSIAAEGVKL